MDEFNEVDVENYDYIGYDCAKAPLTGLKTKQQKYTRVTIKYDLSFFLLPMSGTFPFNSSFINETADIT